MAKKTRGLMGIDNVMKGLNQKLLEYQVSGTRGLRGAAAFIRGDMEKTPPKVPIGKSRKNYVGGTLRSSWFVETILYNKVKQAVIFGFSANYAYWVHENITAKNWSRPGSGPKFMEASIKRNVFKLLKIIGGYMTSGGTRL
jgi:hypothetical protein